MKSKKTSSISKLRGLFFLGSFLCLTLPIATIQADETLTASLAKPQTIGHLSFPQKAGWEVLYYVEEIDAEYTLQKMGQDEGAISLFSISKAEGDADDAEETAKIVKGKVETLYGTSFHGKAVHVPNAAGCYYILLWITNGRQAWKGIYTGTESAWRDAREILAGLEQRK